MGLQAFYIIPVYICVTLDEYFLLLDFVVVEVLLLFKLDLNVLLALL
jgi:hypothetical protein